MSYNTLRINNKEPIDSNIDITFDDFVSGNPVDGSIIKKINGVWSATQSSVSGGTPDLMSTVFFHQANDNAYTPSAFPYSTTYWAYSWPNSSAVGTNQGLYDDAALVNVGRPPSYLYSHNNWSVGIQLTAGTYLITATPTMGTGTVVWSLYHTPTNSLTGTYFGNRVLHNVSDGKTGNMLIGYLEINETRNIYPKVVSGSGTYAGTNFYKSTHWNVRRLS